MNHDPSPAAIGSLDDHLFIPDRIPGADCRRDRTLLEIKRTSVGSIRFPATAPPVTFNIGFPAPQCDGSTVIEIDPAFGVTAIDRCRKILNQMEISLLQIMGHLRSEERRVGKESDAEEQNDWS